MLGDLFLVLKEKLKQCFCVHEYEDVTVNAVRTVYFERCKKCGRVK